MSCCPGRCSSPRRPPAGTWARSTPPGPSPRRSCSMPLNPSSTSPAPRTRPTPRIGGCAPRRRSSTCASATQPWDPEPSSLPPAVTSPTDSSNPSPNTAPGPACLRVAWPTSLLPPPRTRPCSPVARSLITASTGSTRTPSPPRWPSSPSGSRRWPESVHSRSSTTPSRSATPSSVSPTWNSSAGSTSTQLSARGKPGSRRLPST